MSMDDQDQIIGLVPGAHLFKEGDEGNDIYILMDGVFEISRNEKTLSEISESGSFLGEIEALTGEKRSTTVTAKTSCRVLRIPLPLEEILSEHKKLLPKLIQNLEDRRLFLERRIEVHEQEIWNRCLELFLSLFGIRSLIKNPKGDVRREGYLMRLRIEEIQKHADHPHDPNILYRLAQDYGIYEKFEELMAERVGSFAPFVFSLPPVNIRSVNIHEVNDTLAAARILAQQVVEATNHLAALELSSHLEGLDQEILIQLERSLRPEVLVELMNDLFLAHCCHGRSMEDVAHERKRFNVQVEAVLEEARRKPEGTCLLGIAKSYGIEAPYRERLSDLVAIYTTGKETGIEDTNE